ncbi:MAG: hypothetical protein KDA89_10630 [Planctomycetaceae bacterium]|nr:hypothetical protein [Planctomycetaceae bacterium]
MHKVTGQLISGMLRTAALCAAVWMAAGGPAVVSAFDEEKSDGQSGSVTGGLPLLSDMPLPTDEELLKGDVVDWIVLKDNTVIVCEPLYPRPDTLEKRQKELAELNAQRGGSRNAQRDRQEAINKLQYLEITLPDDRGKDYRMSVSAVSDIINFEHLMLRRTDQLIKDGEIRRAYDLLMEVERMAPAWEKSRAAFETLLLKEAEIRIEQGDDYAALALLDELANRNLRNPQLPEVFGSVIERSIAAPLESGDYPQVRYFIGRLSRYFPQHPVVTKWTSQLKQKSQQLLDDARQNAQAGDHADASKAAEQANIVWPITGNERAVYSQLRQRYQTLRVAVLDFGGEGLVSPIPLEADLRHQELTAASLFEPSTADELTYFSSDYFDEWDPRDLGREVVFSLKSTRPYWQSQPLLTANQIAESLSDQLNADSSVFNPRLASFISEFSVRSPTQLKIKFQRVPLSLEGLFRFPIRGTASSQGDSPAEQSPIEEPSQILSTRFEFVGADERHRVYRRMVAEPDGLIGPQYHIAEVVEQKFETRHEQIQAFNRGEVDMLPHLRPWEIDIFKAAGRGFVQQYGIPQNHVIVFNPKSEAVRNPQMRRSLSASIDRENLLKVVVLRDPNMKYGRVTAAPWHSQSYANNPLVEKPSYDIYLAFILRLAALEQLRIPDKQKFVAEAKQKALEAKQDWDEAAFRLDHAEEITAAAAHIQLPKLRMLCSPDEVAMLAAEKIVTRWKLLGFEVELVPANTASNPAGNGDWDLMYRVIRMQEPLLDLWSLLLTDDRFDVDRLSGYPDWMRQELINLDYASSFIDAQDKLFTIHRHIAAQAFLIPLWELDDFAAFQRNVTGFEARPLSVYQGIERWQVKP